MIPLATTVPALQGAVAIVGTLALVGITMLIGQQWPNIKHQWLVFRTFRKG